MENPELQERTFELTPRAIEQLEDLAHENDTTESAIVELGIAMLMRCDVGSFKDMVKSKKADESSD